MPTSCGSPALECVWSSSVGRGLHELAESEGADLLVLGSSRRGLLGRVLVGDHTRAALNRAPCSVAVAPACYCDHFGGIRSVSVPLPALGPGPLPGTDVIEPLLHEARERIAGLGGVAALAGYGPPVDVLASYSESVDLLVVGSRSSGPLGRLVHGSTSEELARTARCALLVLPRSVRRVTLPDDAEERGAIASPDRAGVA